MINLGKFDHVLIRIENYIIELKWIDQLILMNSSYDFLDKLHLLK